MPVLSSTPAFASSRVRQVEAMKSLDACHEERKKVLDALQRLSDGKRCSFLPTKSLAPVTAAAAVCCTTAAQTQED